MWSNTSLGAPLSRWFAGRLNAPAAEVTRVRRIAVGHSRAMFGVDVAFESGEGPASRSFVLRMEQGGVFGTNSGYEVRLMRALRYAGYPVAPVRWYERDPAVLGFPFFVMDRVDGASDAPTEADVRAYVRTLARQHDLDWRRLGLHFMGVPVTARDGALDQIERWYRVYRGACYAPIPFLEEGRAWLRRRAPEAARIVLVHGDSGPANFMYRDGEVTLVTDWEFAHLGDPVEDWVYMATMRGARMFTRDQWSAVFQEEAGVTVSPEEWVFWDAFNHFKGACANVTTLRVFCSGANPAPNMAAIGTGLHLVFLQRLAEIIGANP
jgi:aminoglycoside phosphotransferase (APT) family kinase protein